MPSLAELIGTPPPGLVTILQATVTSVSAGTATIHFGDSAHSVSGVRYLWGASIATGDTVWVLRWGASLLIVGKTEQPGSGPPWTTTTGQGSPAPIKSLVGLELYHAASTPHIDFHRAVDPAGDSNADYNVRLINDTSGRLTLTGGHLLVQNTRVGEWAHSNLYAFFGHSAVTGLGDYCLIQQNDGSTFLNASSGRKIHLRVNNTSVAECQVSGGIGFIDVYHRLIAHSDGQAWHEAGLRSESSGNVDVAIGWHQPNNRAYSFWFGTDRLGRIVRDDGVYPGVYVSVLVPSADEIKENVQPLAAGATTKLKRLRAVSYKQKTRKPKQTATAAASEYQPEEPPGEIGLMATDVAAAYPGAAAYDADGKPSGYSVSSILAILVQAVQELTDRIEALEAGQMRGKSGVLR